MSDPLQPLKPGDPLPTSVRTWNPMLKAARQAQEAPLPQVRPPKWPDDPDTPFRQTVYVLDNYEFVKRGTPIHVTGQVDTHQTEHKLYLTTHGSGSTANYGKAVAMGTVSFLNEPKAADAARRKTSNGGFAPAIVLLQHPYHEYAVLDSRSDQPSEQKFLLSVPYGPYRIVSRSNVRPGETAFPRYVYAAVKDQVTDRSKCLVGLNDPGVTGTPFGQLVLDSGGAQAYHVLFQNVAAGPLYEGRFHFPELSSTDTFPSSSNQLNGIERKYFKSFNAHCLYLCDIWLHGRVTRKVSTVQSGMNIFAPQILALKAYGQREDGTESVIATTPIHLPQICTVLSQVEWDVFSCRLVFAWEEHIKRIRFQIENTGGLNLTDIVTLKGDLNGGGLLIHRLGDRGAAPYAGSRTQGGFTFPDFPEDPSSEQDPSSSFSDIVYGSSQFSSLNPSSGTSV